MPSPKPGRASPRWRTRPSRPGWSGTGGRSCAPSTPNPRQAFRPDQWTPEQAKAQLIHHPWVTPDELASRYPSHLHINLVPRLQSGGHGRRLISTLVGALRWRGSRGVHLGVRPTNMRAIGFYRHLGFTELPATEAIVFAKDLTS
jgi:GNAT superfamily N-acetyltransferase